MLGVVGIGATRNKEFGRLKLSKAIDLGLEQCLPVEGDSCFVTTHPARLSPGQDNSAEVHLAGAEKRDESGVGSWSSRLSSPLDRMTSVRSIGGWVPAR